MEVNLMTSFRTREETWEVAKPLLWMVEGKLCTWRAIIDLCQMAGPSWALWELYVAGKISSSNTGPGVQLAFPPPLVSC